jgi:hypothetical protein
VQRALKALKVKLEFKEPLDYKVFQAKLVQLDYKDYKVFKVFKDYKVFKA